MSVYDIDDLTDERATGPRVAAMGAFDGLHIGHRQLIRAAGRCARQLDGQLMVVTFWPPPQVVMSACDRETLLQTRGQKERDLRELGVDVLVTLPFEQRLAGLSPREFAAEVLVEAAAVDWLYVGFNFTFGRNAQGDVQTLRQLGSEMGFRVQVFPPVRAGGEPISSTRIRRALRAGDVTAAEELLGRPYRLAGRVVRGRGRGGTEIGYPTANVTTDHRLVLPAPGVYAGAGGPREGEDEYPAVINVGGSPTFAGESTAPIEVHLIGFSGPLYGRTVQLHFQRRIRDLQRFDCTGELARQIAADIREVMHHRRSEAADGG